MKRSAAILFTLTMVGTLCLAGCGQKAGNTTQSPAKANTSEAADDMAKTDPIVVSIGYDNNPGEPVDLACQEWKRLVEEKTDGAIVFELYPSSQLGKMTDLVDQALSGDAVIMGVTAGYFADLGVNGFDVVLAPYLINSYDEYDKVHESDWWKGKEEELENVGLKIVSGRWHYGVRHLLSKRPVDSVADMKGLKIRTPQETNRIRGMEALGAVAVPMSLSDVYVALQQGTIDAVENPLNVLDSGAFYEVAKELTLTAHSFDVLEWSIGTKFFDTLTLEQQQAILESGEEAAQYFNAHIDAVADEALEKLKSKGVKVHEIADLQEFRDASEGYYDAPEFAAWPEGLRETIIGIINE